MVRTVRGKGNNNSEQHVVVKDRKISCEYFNTTKVSDNCSQCTNDQFCRKARIVVKARVKIAQHYNYRNWVEEICSPKLPVASVSDSVKIKRAVATVENKTLSIPHYQRDENILKLPTFRNIGRKQTHRGKKRHDLAMRENVPHIHYELE